MRQVVQPLSGGEVKVVDVPRPTIAATEVLVETVSSVISPGTERAVTGLARSSLVGKARARPDLVRQVVRKAQREGLSQTMRSVRSRLDEDLPLGYSAAGIALEVGEAVSGISPGMLVATAGAGKANHADYQAVPGLLCAPVPEGVAAEQASFATIGAIALHGLRLAEVGPGARVAVVGLGLVGRLTLRLARAAGCDAIGIDVDGWSVERAEAGGDRALEESGEATTEAVLQWSRGVGVDAVIVTAATRASDPVTRAPALCRDRASVVVVGDVGLELTRTPFYEKELTLRFARSYGPGRYEMTYEDYGVDYPPGYVRWTEQRNLEAFLALLASGAVAVDDLVTHRFEIADAPDAYDLIETKRERYLAVQLSYPGKQAQPSIQVGPRRATSSPRIGLIGAGNFASSVLVPALREAGLDSFVSVASASGRSATRMAERAGFERVVEGADAVITDPDVDVVVIATPHDTHASLVTRALNAGKHVFCEKPLALSEEELDKVEAALSANEGILFVGFNRRWSGPITTAKNVLGPGGAPLQIDYRVNAGPVPEGHWYADRRQGGRLLGEVCHFIDTVAVLVGTHATAVHAVGSGNAESLLNEDLALLLRYADGSLATINYASGGDPKTPKERIEILGRGHTVVVEDFREITVDGKASSVRPQDKGHVAQMKAFRAALESGDSGPVTGFLGSTRTTLRAAASLTRQG